MLAGGWLFIGICVLYVVSFLWGKSINFFGDWMSFLFLALLLYISLVVILIASDIYSFL